MKKIILIIGGIITLVLSILWYKDVITEPLFAVGTGIITILSLIFIPDKDNNTNKTKINQKHSGIGDNVAGNKTIKN